MLYSGIVSLTQKGLPVDEMMDLIKTADLAAVEWSANCHVPETDPDNARTVEARCDELGIRIASYGTYYYLGQGMDFQPLLDTALILGAPNLRIWAGKKNSEDVSSDERRALVAEAQAVADLAAAHGLTVSFEYHRNTLTNTADSAVQLMREIDRPNIRLYWQPNQFEDVAFNMAALTQVLPADGRIRLTWFQGSAYGVMEYADRCAPRCCIGVKAPANGNSSMTVMFPAGKILAGAAAALVIEGQACDKPEIPPAPLRLTLNGRVIFDGSCGFAKGDWSIREFDIPAKVLREDNNLLTVEDRSDTTHPNGGWVLISQVTLEKR